MNMDDPSLQYLPGHVSVLVISDSEDELAPRQVPRVPAPPPRSNPVEFDTSSILRSVSMASADLGFIDYTLYPLTSAPFDWLHLLVNGEPDGVPRGDKLDSQDQTLTHLRLDNVHSLERRGIQYTFYNSLDPQRFGFIRFAPNAVKKPSKDKHYKLQFLVLQGRLTFEHDGREADAKEGDVLILREGTVYSIRNGDQISLLYMIKLVADHQGR